MNLDKTAQFFESLQLPAPHAQAILGACTECFGGLLLLVGLATRLISIPLLILLAVAYCTADIDRVRAIFSDPDKFTTADEFLFLFAVVILFVFGPGLFSIDGLIGKYFKQRRSNRPMNALLSAGKILAIQLFFGTTFLLAAVLKWKMGVTPDFLQQFGATWLARLPGGLTAVYYFLATLETIALLGLLVSLATGEFLPGKGKPFLKLSLVFSLFLFVILAFGSRLTGKFDIAAINLLYFLAALFCFRETVRDELR